MEQDLAFSVKNRDHFLKAIRNTRFDLLVVGGGITGAGIALDAVTRGLSVCLIEKGDFASGTSGKSTKLIHGGLRYLKQFEFGLVKEVGVERAILHKLAPHLVLPEKMLLPLIKGGSLGKTMTSIGLYIYDFLADVEGDDKRRMLDAEETIALEPLLPEDKLLGGSLYAEYRTDDARLTIEVVKSAYHHGALPINYVEGIGLLDQNDQVIGMSCKDGLTGEVFDIQADYVVNATGPWVDDVRRLGGTIHGKHLYLTKGSHIVVPWEKLPCQQAIYFDVPNDKRMIFAIPRLGVTYVGTTDTYYDSDKNDVRVSRADCDYLLNAVNLTFPGVDLSIDDIVSSWSGVRPLIYEDGKSASEISRKDEIFESDNGLISIAGGKLTGYRKMAERIVDLVAERFRETNHRSLQPCQTDQLPLTSKHFRSYEEVQEVIAAIKRRITKCNLSANLPGYLVNSFGKDAEAIVDKFFRSQDHPSQLNMIKSEIDHCFENEMIVYPADYLIRRSGRSYFAPDTVDDVKTVIFPYFRESKRFSDEELNQLTSAWDLMVKAMTDFQ